MPGKRLAASLDYDLIVGVKHLTQRGKRMNQRAVVFNFGHSGVTPELANCDRLVNPGWSIENAVSKIMAFHRFDRAGIPTPPWTVDPDTAQDWVDKGDTVFCRTAKGLGGLGINICLPNSKIVDAELYTVYMGDTLEFRAHVFNNKVLVRQQKKKMGAEKLAKKGIRRVDPYIRVHNKGWVFAEQDIEWGMNDDMLCIEAVKALGLDFGTVDFVAHMDAPDIAVLEVNTAPGMENRNTFNKYCDAMRRFK